MKNNQAGFTLIEMMLTMGLTLIIMASTMAAMNNAIRASEVASLTTGMNQGLRTAMDIMTRDMLQVGQGMPSGRTIDIPNNNGTAISAAVKLPGAPFTTEVVRTIPATATEITAIIPGPGLGPTINGVATDVITMIQADGSFLSTISDYDVNLTALSSTTMTVDPAVDISNGGADDLKVGDLIMLMKATSTTLVQITALDGAQTATFASGDSLNLNQTAPPMGTLTAHLAIDPKDRKPDGTPNCTNPPTPCFIPTTATRIRLITYYLDNVSTPGRPRLVRRINNGGVCPACSTTYNNYNGTAVAFDVENLQISYDLVDGVSNPSGIKMSAADMAPGGACGTLIACSPNQIRKINVSISGRSRMPMRQTRQYFRNTLTTQVSLRSMSFMDRYK
jgi:prepilin-type N-terminal cleavage/methylation domain-containing protein